MAWRILFWSDLTYGVWKKEMCSKTGLSGLVLNMGLKSLSVCMIRGTVMGNWRSRLFSLGGFVLFLV